MPSTEIQIELIFNSKSNLASSASNWTHDHRVSDLRIIAFALVDSVGPLVRISGREAAYMRKKSRKPPHPKNCCSAVLCNSGDTTHALQHIGNRPFLKAPHYGPVSLFVDIL